MASLLSLLTSASLDILVNNAAYGSDRATPISLVPQVSVLPGIDICRRHALGCPSFPPNTRCRS